MATVCAASMKESDYYLLTNKMLQNTIILVNILRGAYVSVEICFFFGKCESLRSGVFI